MKLRPGSQVMMPPVVLALLTVLAFGLGGCSASSQYVGLIPGPSMAEEPPIEQAPLATADREYAGRPASARRRHTAPLTTGSTARLATTPVVGQPKSLQQQKAIEQRREAKLKQIMQICSGCLPRVAPPALAASTRRSIGATEPVPPAAADSTANQLSGGPSAIVR